ncbi:MAG: hypothetical protein WBM36_09040 [Lysobacterales bacterium]
MNSITKYTLNKQQYLDAISEILKLLRIGENDEKELRELAPDKRDVLSSFLDPTIPAGCFYELSFLEHVAVFLGLAGLAEPLKNIIDQGELFTTDFTALKIEAPEWIDAKEDKSQKSMMFAALYTLVKTIHAIKATSWPINHFIAEGRKGDRSALQQAVKLDTAAITSPTVSAQIIKSDYLDKGRFRRQLNNALRYPHRIERVQHGLLRFVLRTMHDDGMLSQLDDDERFQFFCVEQGIYPNKNDESFDSLNRFIRGCVSNFRT